MKFLNFFLVAVLIFSGTFTSGYALAFDDTDSLILNAGLESGKSKWTASGGTFTTLTSTSEVGDGKASAQFTCTAVGQYVESSLATVSNALVGQPCTTSLKYKDGTGIKVVVRDSANAIAELALTASTAWTDAPKYINYVCPAQVKVRLECTTTNGTVKFDNVKVEENKRLTIIEEASPVGTVIASMLTETQFQTERGTHWVLADGRTVTGSKFATLFGSATLPDLRGQFLRGKNNSRADGKQNVDGEVNLGVYSGDTSFTNFSMWLNDSGSYHANGAYGGHIKRTSDNYGAPNGQATVAAIGTGSETRPRNVTVNYFIKINDVSSLKTFTDSGYALRAGEIITGAFATCPAGTLEANGDAVSRTTYPALFTAIGITHGDGTKLADGTTASAFAAGTGFNLPDYRGRFLRGHSNGSTRDEDRATRTASNVGGVAGDVVGSVQSEAYKSHTHTAPIGDNGSPSAYTGFGGASATFNWTGTTAASGSNETRPDNASVKYCIQTIDTNIVGSFQQITDMVKVTAISANYTATSSDGVIHHSGSSATLTLPLASSVTNKIYKVRSSGGNILTVAFSGGETIEGTSSFVVSGSTLAADGVEIQSTGTGWVFLNKTGMRTEICQISNSGAAAVVAGTGCDSFVSSVATGVTGRVDITYKTGVWGGNYACSENWINTSGPRYIGHDIASSTLMRVYTSDSTAPVNVPFSIHCTGRR